MNSKLAKYFCLYFCVLFTIAVSAFGQAGQLDPTFGKGGIATLRVETTRTTNFFSAGGIAIQGDGKIVVAGGVPGSNDFTVPAVVRFLSNGTLDKTFGANGVAVLPNSFGPYGSVAIQSDGKILVGGGGTNANGEIDRFTTTGNLDSSFGTGGRVSFHLASTVGLALQPDGRILVALHNIAGPGPANKVTRLLANGTTDATFGTNGFAFPPGGSGTLAVLSNGDILVFAGLISRLTNSGAVDTTFGVNGQLLAQANGHTLAADGDILVAGTLVNDPAVPSTGFAAFAYQSAGIGDPAFGTNGGVTTPLSAFPTVTASDLGLESTGAVVELATASNTNSSAFGLVRYTAQGQLDTSFGSGGTVTTTFGNNAGTTSANIGIQTDDKIVATGTALTSGLHGEFTTVLVVARYLGK